MSPADVPHDKAGSGKAVAEPWSFCRALGLGAALGALALLIWLLIVVKSVVLLACYMA
jgi:hypothetical protein